MFSSEAYLNAWLFYLLGAALFLTAWWFVTARLAWREARLLLRALAGVFFLLPWPSGLTVAEGSDYLSPAWVVALFELLLDGPEAFWRAGTPLLLAMLVAVLLSSGVHLGLWYWSRRQGNA